jgi:hypothetical protein
MSAARILLSGSEKARMTKTPMAATPRWRLRVA